MENPIKNITETIIGECRNFKHTLKEILYAIVIVLLINTFLIQNYQIPTGSMIPIIMPGDRLFANRFVYGVKLPFTDGLLGYRLPKIKSPQRGDLVVFRAPPSASFGCESAMPYYEPSPLVQMLKLPVMIFALTPFTWDPRFLLADYIGEKLTGGTHMAPVPLFLGLKTVDLDPRKEFVKRVIATAGETVEIRNKKIIINGNEIEDKWGYFFYGNDREFVPRIDIYGPIYVPKKGDVIIFKKLVDRDDYYNDFSSFEVYINDKVVSDDIKLSYWMNIYVPNAKDRPDEYIYNVPEDYFFVMGDNRDQSCDSRMWGLVPYRHIKGQPMIAWIQSKRPDDVEQGFFKYFIIK
ncbi:signal peptidase I [Brachyspira hyodysenteriae]|uniref:signal peptidase I n=1 Tax=Brachyspira hyodysenteriae TaxID=159 RepID=UPI00063D8BAC|nr:signal peptidase I [Brachyspira hyodysenteriae]KLI29254.1 signal peptidase I [Brachyspira hyodysenteriae]